MMTRQKNVTVKDILVRALELIECGWIKKAATFAIDPKYIPNGVMPKFVSVGFDDPRACSFCAMAAIERAGHELVGYNESDSHYIRQIDAQTVVSYNDNCLVTKKDVIQLFKRAIRSCR